MDQVWDIPEEVGLRILPRGASCHRQGDLTGRGGGTQLDGGGCEEAVTNLPEERH